jgi:Ca-activated chloride channel family protein
MAALLGLTLVGGQTGAQTNAGVAKPQGDPMELDVTQGALRIKQNGAVLECPLKHTDVKAEVSGFIARVKVTQTFFNPSDEKIEAVYVFPLPHESAVDDMTMLVADRRIVGLIKRRTEARQIYEAALAAGTTAALLEQERPNIFVQSVGNIPPKQDVRIEISYVDVLKYDQGCYEFHFPMVVGPRYNPAGFQGGIGAVPTGQAGASGQKVEIAYQKPGERTGHDIALALRLDAGVPIKDLKSINHKAEIETIANAKAAVVMSKADSVPNKDFILKYKVMGPKPEMAVLTHAEGGKGYFLLMIQPKEDEKLNKQPPREIVFMIDVSGSMSGLPTEKSKEAMKEFLSLMRENKDTVQVVTFAGNANKLFEKPVLVTKENIAKALNFTQGLRGGGGTEMLKGVQMAINEPMDNERMRIVIMLTDGFIGNEAQILEAVGKGCGDQIRFWCVGVGSSVNRFLVDGVAKQGGGMGKVLALNESAVPLVKEFMERIQRAQLSKIKIEWGDLAVSDTYPARLPELWAGRPVIIYGLYDTKTAGKTQKLMVKGNVEGEDVSWPVAADFPVKAKDNLALSRVWARQKIEDLMQQTFYAGSPEVEEAVTSIALEYRLMSQYTSFVAVDEKDAAAAGEVAKPPRRIMVSVPLPEGVSFEGVFGGGGDLEFPRELAMNRLADAKKDMAMPRRHFGAGRMAPGLALQAAGSKTIAAPSAAMSQSLALSGFGGAYAAKMECEESNGREYYKYVDRSPAGWAFMEILQTQNAEIAKRVAAATNAAEGLKTKENWAAARAQYALAYFLDSELMAAGASAGATAGAAAGEIEKIDKKLLAGWVKDNPALDRKLDLILRDKSLAEALETVAKAAGLKIRLLPGSVEDAAALTAAADIRVSFLDLRGIKTAQALDWLLRPNRLTWQPEKKEIVVGSSRRLAGESAWVYDVAALVMPSEAETKATPDHNKLRELVKGSADSFKKSAAQALSLKDDALAWFAPGQLLIFADEKTHASAGQLFADLADPKAKLEGDLAKLQAVTAKRAANNRNSAAQQLAVRDRGRLLAALNANSWALLAAAAEGKLDLEALTELQIAWKNPGLAELGKTAPEISVLRSAWAVNEAAGALPKEAELQALAELARKAAQTSAEASLAALQKTPQDQNACLQTLYAALTLRNDKDYVGKAQPVLLKGAGEVQTVTAALLNPAKEINPKGLAETLAKGVQGNDWVALTALACRRAGGETWTAFRANSQELLGRQPLAGGVVVLVNNLASARLPALEH